jgi:hypothetical protein
VDQFSETFLIQLRAAGGGFAIEAGNHQLNFLVQLAAAGRAKRPTLRIRGVRASGVPEQGLVQIAAAGEGTVFFED